MPHLWNIRLMGLSKRDMWFNTLCLHVPLHSRHVAWWKHLKDCGCVEIFLNACLLMCRRIPTAAVRRSAGRPSLKPWRGRSAWCRPLVSWRCWDRYGVLKSAAAMGIAPHKITNFATYFSPQSHLSVSEVAAAPGPPAARYDYWFVQGEGCR